MRMSKTIAVAVVALMTSSVAGAYLIARHVLSHGSAGLGIAVGAQIGCADVFLMHRSVSEAERDDVHALAPAASVIHLKVYLDRQTVTASVPGLISRTASFTPGIGCTLQNGPVARPSRAMLGERSPAAQLKASAPVGAALPRLQAAVDRVFNETNLKGYPDTRAIVVMQGGQVAAERYAPGFSASTPFLGWSATKSVTSALAGVLVGRGRLQLDAPAPVAEWRKAGDPRGAITLRQLLTMSSGLKFMEDYGPGSDATQMLFHERDMAAYAARQPLDHPPGRHWSYSSGTANIVAQIVRDAVGGTDEAFNRFARNSLFVPAGLDSMLIEPDQNGTPVGSSYGYATARDWARFGFLYLNDGMAAGRRVLPEGWVQFTRTPTPAAPTPLYSAMFWLNQGPAQGPSARAYPHCPPDMYLADGYNGQFVAVVPSMKVVIARLGWTPEGRPFNVDRYFSAILSSLPQSQT